MQPGRSRILEHDNLAAHAPPDQLHGHPLLARRPDVLALHQVPHRWPARRAHRRTTPAAAPGRASRGRQSGRTPPGRERGRAPRASLGPCRSASAVARTGIGLDESSIIKDCFSSWNVVLFGGRTPHPDSRLVSKRHVMSLRGQRMGGFTSRRSASKTSLLGAGCENPRRCRRIERVLQKSFRGFERFSTRERMK